MWRFLFMGALLSVLALTFTGKALATTIVAGEKSRTSELAELVNAYGDLDGEDNKDLKAALKVHIERLMNDEKVRTENIQHVVSWSRTSSNVTFWITHILLGLGLLAAAMELIHSWRLRSKGSSKETFEMEVGLEKIALRSSMYGILLFLTSLSFYFMYLKFVYPVSYIQ